MYLYLSPHAHISGFEALQISLGSFESLKPNLFCFTLAMGSELNDGSSLLPTKLILPISGIMVRYQRWALHLAIGI